MAHSDVLIFLTNITWMFFLFLFLYFFFVLFFLPSFYKKVRLFLVNKAELAFLSVHFSSLLPAGPANGLFFVREFKLVFSAFCGLVLGLITFALKSSYSDLTAFLVEGALASGLLSVYLVEGFITNLPFLIDSDEGYFLSIFKRI